jgi:curli biogenesis system outer membrane secretion channel CsgG
MRDFCGSAFAVAIGSVILSAPAFAAPLRVAVYPFDQTNVSFNIKAETRATVNYGAVAAELLGSALQAHVQIINRDQIQRILEEQGRRYDERFDPAHAAEFGRLLGADAILTGSIVALDVQKSTSSGIGGITDAIGGIIGRKAKIPKIDTKTDSISARVQLMAKLINTATGATMISQGSGFAEDETLANIKVNGRGTSDVNASRTGSDPYIRAALQQAVDSISQELAGKIAATPQTHTTVSPPGAELAATPRVASQEQRNAHVPLANEVGVVWKADGAALIFFISPGVNVRPSEMYEVQRPEMATHPITGKVVAMGQKIGSVEVTTQSGEYGRGTYRGEPVKPDDRVVAVK